MNLNVIQKIIYICGRSLCRCCSSFHRTRLHNRLYRHILNYAECSDGWHSGTGNCHQKQRNKILSKILINYMKILKESLIPLMLNLYIKLTISPNVPLYFDGLYTFYWLCEVSESIKITWDCCIQACFGIVSKVWAPQKNVLKRIFSIFSVNIL